VFGTTEPKLEPDALVAREQGEETVGGGATHDLEPALPLERAQRAYQITTMGTEPRAKPGESLPPEIGERNQVLVASRSE